MGKQKKEGNLFDKMLKENAEALFLPLIAKRLGIKILSSKLLPEKTQTTLEREVDFLRLIKTSAGEEMIIHIEFQTQGNREMVYRMSEYHGIELRKHKIKIKHFVVYLGKSKTKMRSKLKQEEIFTGFELINLHELKTDDFLSSRIPAEIMLAILADFDKKQSERIIRLIIEKLKLYSKNENELRKFLKQLTVLSRLRNLDSQTKKIVRIMPVTYDITKDSFYQEGLEQGLEQGLEKTKVLIRNMLNKGFDVKTIAELGEVTQKFVKQIQKEMQEKK
ncbi:MAG: hypothetical protein AB8F94_13405 [Saprospiraceae bacterium]